MAIISPCHGENAGSIPATRSKFLNEQSKNKNTKYTAGKRKRLFYTQTIEDIIQNTSDKINDPILKRMFIQCFPNTLDTATYYYEDKNGNPDTFIATGDIPAMWLRDSTNQVWSYLSYINQDNSLKKLFMGLINRQTQNILLDPHANAFTDTKGNINARNK